MENEGQQPPEAPQQPEAPQLDPRQALELAAQQFGTSPEVLESAMRLQEENKRVYEENRRRERDLELREAQIDALAKERARSAPREPEFEVDPVVKPIYDKMNRLERLFTERVEREEVQEQSRQEAIRKGNELNSHFQAFMRGVPSQSQVDERRFFGAMEELWPDGPPPGVSPAVAVERTGRYLGIQNGIYSQGNGYIPQATSRANPYRDPKAEVVIRGAAAVPGATPNGVDMSPQRAGETIEAYSQRIEQSGRALQDMLRQSGLNSLPERYSSG